MFSSLIFLQKPINRTVLPLVKDIDELSIFGLQANTLFFSLSFFAMYSVNSREGLLFISDLVQSCVSFLFFVNFFL